MKAIIVLFLINLLVCELEAGDDASKFVKPLSQFYEADSNTKLVNQITLELQASYIYNGYASYFQRADVNLPGLQKFFAKASVEERHHANMLMDYINKRGGVVRLDTINMQTACVAVAKDTIKEVYTSADHRFCICGFVSNQAIGYCRKTRDSTWKDGLMALEDALAMERYVNDKLIDIHNTTSDAHLNHFLEHEMLEEQVEAIYELGGYVTRLRQFSSNYKLGEYIFDQNLK